jgi:hypothetical protein
MSNNMASNNTANEDKMLKKVEAGVGYTEKWALTQFDKRDDEVKELKAQLAEYNKCPASKTCLEMWKKLEAGSMTKTRHLEVGFEQIFDSFIGLVESKKAGEEMEKILKNMTSAVEERAPVDPKKRKREEKKSTSTSSEEKHNAFSNPQATSTTNDKKKRKRTIEKKTVKYGVVASAVSGTIEKKQNLIQFTMSEDKPLGLVVIWLKGEVLDFDQKMQYHPYPEGNSLVIEVAKNKSQCYLFSLFQLGASKEDVVISWAGKFDVYDLVGKRNIGVAPTMMKQEFVYTKKTNGDNEDWFVSDKTYREILKIAASKKCSNIDERHIEFASVRDKIIATK